MDPNTQPAAQPTDSAAAPVPANPEVPTNTPTSEAPAEHKKSFLDSIMTMFGMGPKEEAPTEATPVEATPAATPIETPPTPPQQ